MSPVRARSLICRASVLGLLLTLVVGASGCSQAPTPVSSPPPVPTSTPTTTPPSPPKATLLPTSTPPPPPTGRILFRILSGAQRDLGLINADGGGFLYLTNTPEQSEAAPAISPDGKWVAYLVLATDKTELHVVDISGQSHQKLTDIVSLVQAPVWSPDSRQIYFTAKPGQANEIFAIDASGGEPRPIGLEGTVVALAPSGKLTYQYVFGRTELVQVWVANLDGGEPFRITDETANYMFPAWSPDGKRLVLVSNRGTAGQQVYVLNADGSGLTQLTTGPNQPRSPVWSPDGRQILFTSFSPYVPQLYRANTDDSALVQLTDDPAGNRDGQWSPDGNYIVFVSERDGQPELYRINADGSHPARLTNIPGNAANDSPTWIR